MIGKDAIEKIESMAKANTFRIGEVDYSDKPLQEIKKPATPNPETLGLHTLSGIVDYIQNKLDDEKKYTVQIMDYNLVSIFGEFEPEYGRRRKYVVAGFIDFDFRFDNFYPHEEFIINLQAQFEQDNSFKEFMRKIGNIQAEGIIQTKDDGCSQMTTIKDGIVNMENVVLPNPVTLTPRRTFPEIKQPSSQFVLRMRKQNGIQLALFEASGGFWRVECIHTIRDYLREQLKGAECVIIA